MNARLLQVAGLVLLFLFTHTSLLGQAVTGSLVVVVKDPSGAVVPKADLGLVDAATQVTIRTGTTDEDGRLLFTLISPGTYRVEVNAAGFRRATVAAVKVGVGEAVRTEVSLAMGSLEQELEVQSSAPLIATETAVTGMSLESKAITSLPLVNRNYYELLSLTPGTSSELNQGGVALGRGITDIQVSGQRTAAVNFQIQGVNVNDFEVATADKIALPNPDFLQEFTVSTSMYDASQSRAGGLVNVAIKSGQQQFHGSLFHFFRNEKLNANDVFLKAQGKGRPVLKENQFGGAIGGKVPVGRLFFFTGYQGWRQRNGYVGGISTAIPVLPTTRTAETLGAAFGLDPARIDPVAVKILNLQHDRFGGPFLIPSLPGTPGRVAPFAASAPGKFRSDQGVLRLDRQWSSDIIYGAFFLDDWETYLPLGGGFGAPNHRDLKNVFTTFAWTHVYGQRTTTQARLGYNRLSNIIKNAGFFSTQEVGMNSPNAELFPGLPQFVITGFLTMGSPDPDSERIQNIYSADVDATHISGRHALRVGGGVTQYRFKRSAVSFGIGRLDFNPKADPRNGKPLNAMQAFLLGLPSTLRLAQPGSFGNLPLLLQATDFNLYVHDDWAVTQKLKLNLGLRIELLEMPWDTRAYRISVFDVDDYAAGRIGFKLPEDFELGGIQGTPGVKRCGVNDCRHVEFGPRIGLAYQSSHKTVVRSGYGLYYARVGQQPVLLAANSVPFGSASGVTTNQVGLQNAFAAVPPPSSDILTSRPTFRGLQSNVCRSGSCFTFPAGWGTPNPLALDFHPPKTHMWNLVIGHELGRSLGVEVGYVGTKGTSLINRRNPNQPLRASPEHPIVAFGSTITTNTVDNAWLRAPLLGLDPGRFRLLDNSAYSYYHSLQISAMRRRAPVFLQVGYTWSKNIDISSQGGSHADRLSRLGDGQELSQFGSIGDQTDLTNQRAVSDNDKTHRLTIGYVVDLPTPPFARDSRAGRALLAGWSVSGTTIFQSGTPYSVFDSGGGTAFGGGSQGFTQVTANPAGVGPIKVNNDNPSQYLNAADFARTLPAPGGGPNDTDFGTLGRNAFRSPFQQNWDLSLTKHFPVTERSGLDFRVAFFNVWNHPVYDVPDRGFTDVRTIDTALAAASQPQPNFGVARATVTQPRTIQFSLRYSF